METAYFAAGCFWGVQDAFDKLGRDLQTTVGYMNGHTDNPTYEDVCSHATGHAEAVKVVFDPAKITYAQLLDAFWDMHDPTQHNRQGPDIGDQYRSAIFTTSDEQTRQAVASRDAIATDFDEPITTIIEPAQKFWPAEEYHQKYFQKTGQSSCHV